MNYSDYTAQISLDDSDVLTTMIKSQFPGITIHRWTDGDGNASTKGPDQAVCDDIDLWISENWTAAL